MPAQVEQIGIKQQVDAFYDDVFRLGTPYPDMYQATIDGEEQRLVGAVSADYVRLGVDFEASFGEHPEFLMRRDNEQGENVVSFRVVNGLNGSRHPLIRPSQLFARSLRYFEETEPVSVVEGRWEASPEGSINYAVYTATLAALTKGRKVTSEDRKLAVLSTWTGARAVEAGFSVVERVETGKRGMVSVRFIRP